MIKETISSILKSILFIFFIFLLWVISLSYFTKVNYLFVPAFLIITTICGVILYRHFKKIVIQILPTLTRCQKFYVPSELYASPHNKHEIVTNIVNKFISSYITKNNLTPPAYINYFLMDSEKIQVLKNLIEQETEIDIAIDELKKYIIVQFHALNYQNFKNRVLCNVPAVDQKTNELGSSMKSYATTYYKLFAENNDYDTYMDNLLCEVFLNDFVPINEIRQELRVELMKNNLNNPHFSLDNFYTISDVDNMDGYTFEFFVAALLKNMGYWCKITPSSGDQGADIIAEKHGKKTAVQCKNYSDKVGNKAIQEVVASIKYYYCDRGLVITNNYLTDSAIELAQVNAIDYWDRDKLVELLNNYPVPKELS
ncbi:putative helicase [Desulfohalotomaculum tongense]|uniref:restriction endonuclease n=1 Tax=Desulforadius tongensis TaxID=1216062 RepID=UPI001958E7F5|nr:restriction endonuclease [Desulforadius tongensis]MBM7856175.1 putative helicase [Desulforadius tongensis]